MMKKLFVLSALFLMTTGVYGQKAVDLGLSVNCADCNVGASSPQQVGNYYAYGKGTHRSPFNSVKMWKITLTAVTTIFDPVSAEEAKRIEAEGDEDYWVDYNEDERQWYVHGHAEVEVGSVTITDAKWVNRLNQLMQKSKYDEYRQEVTIRGKVAYATWYEGNRGGGIEEDFPKDLAKYINSLRH